MSSLSSDQTAPLQHLIGWILAASLIGFMRWSSGHRAGRSFNVLLAAAIVLAAIDVVTASARGAAGSDATTLIAAMTAPVLAVLAFLRDEKRLTASDLPHAVILAVLAFGVTAVVSACPALLLPSELIVIVLRAPLQLLGGQAFLADVVGTVCYLLAITLYLVVAATAFVWAVAMVAMAVDRSRERRAAAAAADRRLVAPADRVSP